MFAKNLFCRQSVISCTLRYNICRGSMPTSTPKFLSSNKIKEIGDFAKIDLNRADRCGFPEVVFALGKSKEQLTAIMKEVHNLDRDSLLLATKVDDEQFDHIVKDLGSSVQLCRKSRIAYVGNPGSVPQLSGTVAVLCAGTSDYFIAEEAARLLELSGIKTVSRLYDVGVAGLGRLLSNLPIVQAADVVIVCAGMDGALPSVVGGLSSAPVIAVPTSVGYGASFKGVSALLTMLNSCAPGVTVVNIDNGFGAAVTAHKILSKMNREESK